jgi:heme/copper-type cytochrome/quinol oxidase subunit 1
VVTALCALLVTERLAGVRLWHGAGGDPELLEHWLRLAVAPLGAVALLPAVGVIGDAIVTATNQPLVGRRTVGAALWALALFGSVAALARLGGDDPEALAVASFFSLAMAVPLTLILGNAIVSLTTMKLRGSPALWFAVAALVLLAELAIAGAPLAILDRGPRLSASVFAEAHDELVWAAIGFAVAAALYRAWPTLTSARPSASWAHIACGLGFAGVQLATAAELVAGARGMPRGYAYPPEFHGWAIAATVGTILWMAAAALIAGSLTVSLRRRAAPEAS